MQSFNRTLLVLLVLWQRRRARLKRWRCFPFFLCVYVCRVDKIPHFFRPSIMEFFWAIIPGDNFFCRSFEAFEITASEIGGGRPLWLLIIEKWFLF